MGTRWLWGTIGLAIAGLISGCILLVEQAPKPIQEQQSSLTESTTNLPTTEQPRMAAVTAQSDSTTTTAQPEFLLKLENDTLVVYQIGTVEPLKTIPIMADWLPDYDKILLEYGIQVKGTSELRQLLEDYTS